MKAFDIHKIRNLQLVNKLVMLIRFVPVVLHLFILDCFETLNCHIWNLSLNVLTNISKEVIWRKT